MFEEKIAALNKKTEADIEALPSYSGKKVLTVKDVGEILRIKRTNAYNICNRGYFRVLRIGTRLRIDRKSFEAWLDGEEEKDGVHI